MPSLRGSRWGDNEPDGKDRYHRRIPILPTLDEILQAGPCADLAFICGENGRPLTKESFGNLFRDACNAAGVAKSAHAVRKIGATRAANNGATVGELEAIFGWQGGGMASLYTRAADRARLAKGAMAKLDRMAGEQSIPAPRRKCGRRRKKMNNSCCLDFQCGRLEP